MFNCSRASGRRGGGSEETQGRVPPLADGENGVRKGRASPGCTTVSGVVELGLMTSATFSSPLPAWWVTRTEPGVAFSGKT